MRPVILLLLAAVVVVALGIALAPGMLTEFVFASGFAIAAAVAYGAAWFAARLRDAGGTRSTAPKVGAAGGRAPDDDPGAFDATWASYAGWLQRHCALITRGPRVVDRFLGAAGLLVFSELFTVLELALIAAALKGGLL